MFNKIPDLELFSPGGEPLFRVRTCRHGVMAYLVHDTTIGRALEIYGEFAESENHLMAALLKPGDVAIDVGANVGTVALSLARAVGQDGVVYLFEPQPVVFQLLCTTLTLNGLTQTKVFRSAVGSELGEVFLPPVSPSQALNYGAVRVEKNATGEPTPLVTIDSLELQECNLIKIDVEGMDYDVLLGATQTVARARPYIYMEAKTGPATQHAIAWLMAKEYRCYWHFAAFFSPNNLRQVKENVFGNTGDINLLAIPDETGREARLPRITTPQANWQADYQEFFSSRSSSE